MNQIREENEMQDVAIVSFVQSDCVRYAGAQNEVELIMPVVQAALKVFPNSQVELVKENEITSKIENGKRNNNDDLGGKNI